MHHPLLASLALTALLGLAGPIHATDTPGHDAKAQADEKDSLPIPPERNVVTSHRVRIDGRDIAYKATAGTLLIGDDKGKPTVSMFYVAYTVDGGKAANRPVTFLFNGGPGSSSMWLHMGSFGPVRVANQGDQPIPPPPYSTVPNQYSLLDKSDLVFIDAPGTGYSQLVGDAKGKDFYGLDQDADAFARFITRYVGDNHRWNAPKFLFGESYGTTRSAVVANILTNEKSVDLNGVILLSQILSFDTSIDGPQNNPGIDLPYILGLPTFAATAWYHHKLPQQPPELEPFVAKVEKFATGEYARTLMAGGTLDATRKQAVAGKLHQYTGLPVKYLLKANLRVNGGMFEHELLGDDDTTTGRLDTRFSGPSIDPMGKSSDYDPQSSAISSAYVSTFNNYVRQTLKFGKNRHYRLFAGFKHWDFSHKAPGAHRALQQSTNVMPDLATAMKTDPLLKVMMVGGYYDLATPFFAAEHELDHLPIPDKLRRNISVHLYPSGHMVYAHKPSLKALHDDVAAFIHATEGGG